MKLEHAELVDEFYDMISPTFPGLTRQEVNLICCSPFTHLKRMIEGDKVDYMRLKYFGSFVVYPRKAKSELSYLDKRLENKVITQEQYNKYKKMLTNYIDDYEKTKRES